MADKTGIEWADATWTPIRAHNRATGKVGWHCTHVSEGCRNCYAEKINLRLGTGLPYKPGHEKDIEIFVAKKLLTQPLRWRKPRRIFLNSMTDTFGDFVTDAMLDRIFATMALCPQHTFIVLTKRPERMRHTIERTGKSIEAIERPARELGYTLKFDGHGLVPWPLPNVIMGVSAEDQATADARIPILLDTPAALRCVSLEPLLGPIDLSMIDVGGDGYVTPLRAWTAEQLSKEWGETIRRSQPRLDWVIVGGESGPGARPMHPDWVRSLRDQCAAADVPFFFKQWGEWAPHSPAVGGDLGADVRSGRVTIVHPSGRSDIEIFEATGGRSTEPGTRYMRRVGKRAAGNLLDGRQHMEWPELGR